VDDCLKRGKTIKEGGSNTILSPAYKSACEPRQFPGSHQKVVFEEQKISKAELLRH
jgi:hypothetical protein